MDLHVIIVIACVFLASLSSILFINKFFKSKTYEEAAAEKKALVDKLYPSTNKIYHKRQPRKQLTSKRDKKRQQHQQQQAKQQQRETTENDSNDSDNQSIDTKSIESSPSHSVTKKLHVEFSEPEIIETTISKDNQQQQPQRRSSDTKINSTIGNSKSQQQKRKMINTKQTNSGILINKSEPTIIKEELITPNLNHFEFKQPKDFIELKKSTQAETDLKHKNNQQQNQQQKKSNKSQMKNVNTIITNGMIDDLITNDLDDNDSIQLLMKSSSSSLSNTDSPKNSNKPNKNLSKINKKDKDLLTLIDKINFDGTTKNDSIGVNCIMSLVSHAELNRNDIQILIDYLLNKQQDTITITHSEWSDDIVQKLRKQLNEKEKQLQEEQEASIGLQGKLRDLRTDINTERAVINSTNKAYLDEILSKKNDINNLNQEIQNLNEKLQSERQQFKLKILHENQKTSQELLQQIQPLNDRINLLQNELNQKQNELQLLSNASCQALDDSKKKYSEINDICKQHVEKILYLEKCLNDSEKNQLNVRQQYDLEMIKAVENEKDSNKVEIRNFQNALDSTKSELQITKNDLLNSKENINILTKHLNEQNLQLSKNIDLNNSLTDMQNLSDDKDKMIADYELKLNQLIQQNDELMNAFKEQKDKNNELRTKNWKLVDALKNAETTADSKLSSANSNSKKLNNLVVDSSSGTHPSDNIKEQQNIRDLLQRLYPNEINKITELSTDEFVDYINKLQIQNNINTTNLNSENNKLNNHNTSHNHNNIKQNKIDINNTNKKGNTSNISNSNNNTSNSSNDDQSLLLENVQLRTRIEHLTKIVNRTENMLNNLETQAREQEAHWRTVVQSKQEEINLLKNKNGEINI